jgi:hypothetical protein
MGIAAEFARFNAKLVNVQWAVSARTDAGVVISLWQHKLRNENGVWVYRDHLSRWKGAGSRLLGEHLHEALEHSLALRMVKAIAAEPDLVDRGEDASKTRKTFHAVMDRVGRVESFDGDVFELVFERVPSSAASVLR